MTRPPGARLPELPLPLTSLVGREREIAAVTSLFEQTGARLVTLTGTGGIGKTRLALAVAEQLGSRFPDSVWFVSLASIADPDLVLPTIARVLEIAEQADQPMLERLTSHLRERQALLVLDNFEHVVEAAGAIAHVLAACPALAVLVTSREPLHLSGEHEYAVPPLEIAEASHGRASVPLPDGDAVELFVERAKLATSDFALTTENSPVIVAICLRLEGLPLALELAAARIKLLSPGELLERLDQPLALLTGGPRDVPERQQTMRATLQWSYDLLSPEEQQLFRGLSVFAGGWTLAAAEAVVEGGDVLERLSSLVDKGLVRRVEPPGQPARYGMLEPVRQFAMECLTEHGDEAHEARQQHARYFESIVKGLRTQLDGPDGLAVFERIESEHDNLRAAMCWLRESGQVERGLVLTGDMPIFWMLRGYVGEGLSQIAAMLASPRASRRTIGRTRALWAASWLRLTQGDVEAAFRLSDEALAIAEEQGDRIGLAGTLHVLGLCRHQCSDPEQTRCNYERALSLFREIEDNAMVSRVLVCLGQLASRHGDVEQARALVEEGLALARARCLHFATAVALSVLGPVAELSGDDEQAAGFYAERLALYHELGAVGGIAETLEPIARFLHRQRQPEAAVCLHGVTSVLHERSGTRYADMLQYFDLDEELNALRAALSTADFEAAWTRGREMPLDDAIALAQQSIVTIKSESTLTPPAGLTAREVEVLQLLAAGKSNRQIAGELYISSRTVERHVVNTYRKIDVHNRAEATAFALANGLV